jgi:hypothetical protein
VLVRFRIVPRIRLANVGQTGSADNEHTVVSTHRALHIQDDYTVPEFTGTCRLRLAMPACVAPPDDGCKASCRNLCKVMSGE